MPRWIMDLGGWKFQSVAFAAEDNESLFRAYSSGGETVEIEQFDLQGALIQTYSIPYPFSFFSMSDVVQAPGNAFYLPVEDFDRVLYSDPDSQTSWVGVTTDLPAEQIPSIRHGLVNDEGDLVFIGMMQREAGSDPLREWGVGRIGRDGHLKSFNIVAGTLDVFTLYKNDKGGFDAIGLLPMQEDGLRPQVFLEFDVHGDLVRRTESRSNVQIFGYAKHRWLGQADGVMGVFDNKGERLHQVDFQQAGGFQTIDVESGFYTLGTSGGTEFDGIFFGGAPVVCFHNAQYVRQWCNTLQELSSYLFSNIQLHVDATGRLLLSFGLERSRLISAGVDIQSFLNGVYGDLEIRGEERRELQHFVFDTKGKRVLQARAEPYFHQGAASICFLDLCVAKEKVHPGFGGFSDSLLLPGGRIYSFASFWNGEPGGDSYQEQLLYWGP
ncbi:MAG TPA: hypothetical protein VM553_10785 [Dongiaceae bacterium]|nr:hypothetical protein [Dongiaceae bacterium]